MVEEPRRISRESCVSFKACRYSVPYKYAGMGSMLRIADEEFRILVNGAVVARHPLLQGTGRTSREKEYFKGLLGDVMKENNKGEKSRLCSSF